MLSIILSQTHIAVWLHLPSPCKYSYSHPLLNIISKGKFIASLCNWFCHQTVLTIGKLLLTLNQHLLSCTLKLFSPVWDTRKYRKNNCSHMCNSSWRMLLYFSLVPPSLTFLVSSCSHFVTVAFVCWCSEIPFIYRSG